MCAQHCWDLLGPSIITQRYAINACKRWWVYRWWGNALRIRVSLGMFTWPPSNGRTGLLLCKSRKDTLSNEIKTRSGFIQFVFLTLADWPSRFHAPHAVQTEFCCGLVTIVLVKTQTHIQNLVMLLKWKVCLHLLQLKHFLFLFSLFSETKQLVMFFSAIALSILVYHLIKLQYCNCNKVTLWDIKMKLWESHNWKKWTHILLYKDTLWDIMSQLLFNSNYLFFFSVYCVFLSCFTAKIGLISGTKTTCKLNIYYLFTLHKLDFQSHF